MGIETAIIGSAILGAGTSLYGASQGSKAAKDAASAQTQANNQAIAFQREQRDIAQQQLAPYQARGNAAFALMAPHLGMGGGAPSAANGLAPPPTGLGTSRADQMQAYFQQNKPAIEAFYRQNGKTFDRMGRDWMAATEHYFNTEGWKRGDRLPTPGAPATGGPAVPGTTGIGGGAMMPGGDGQQMAQGGGDMAEYQTPGQAQEEAWNKYRTETTFGKIGDFYADKAGREFVGLAGSQGSALSGRTARGMAEVANEAAMGNFNSYMGYLGGISDQGYGATTGIASAGQNFANNASQLTQASGSAVAQGKLNSASAWQSGLSDVAGWGGWAAGQLYKPQNKAA